MLRRFMVTPTRLKLELLFYPFILFLKLPPAWASSIKNAKVLLVANNSKYMGFYPQNAINSLFYKTQWVNLQRYGRLKNSKCIGLGNFPIRNWFHLSAIASATYANAGAATTLIGTLFWVLGHFVWIGDVETYWLSAVVISLFISSTAYSMAFFRQNYQILGWMCYPFALFLMQGEHYLSASFAWFAGGLAGLTPIVFAFPIVAVFVVYSADLTLFFVMAPAVLLAASRFMPLLQGSNLKDSCISIAKMIGLTKSKVKYKRERKTIGLTTLYFTTLYSTAAFLISWDAGQIVVFPFLGMILFLINQTSFRVADEQSVMVVSVTLFTFTTIQAEPSLVTLFGYWLAVCPTGFFLTIQNINASSNLGYPVKTVAPFDMSELELEMEGFFKAVRPGSRVYFAHEDPKGLYAQVFDGYRVLNELPLYVASKKEIHLFPDWWAVYETNYEGAPTCWGRSITEVRDNCQRWAARYALIYSFDACLNDKWLESFNLVAEFDWAKYQKIIDDGGLLPPSVKAPKWFLLKQKA